MNSDDLALFELVASAGGVSSAAIRGAMDASTLSRRISQLEKSVGARLFTRSGRGMSLTAKGEALLEHARQIAALMDSARATMSSTSSGPASIHIAAQPTLAKVLFGRLYHVLRARYPATQVRFTEGLADRILDELQSGEVDIAIMYRPSQTGGLVCEPMLMERLYLLAPANSDVTLQQVEADGVADIPMVLPSTHHGLRVLVQAMAASRHRVQRIALESDSAVALTIDLVRQGCGCTVLPLAAARAEVDAGRLRAFPLPGDEGERCVALVMGRTSTAAADLWRVNEMIRDLVRRLAGTPEWPGTRPIGPGLSPSPGAQRA